MEYSLSGMVVVAELGNVLYIESGTGGPLMYRCREK